MPADPVSDVSLLIEQWSNEPTFKRLLEELMGVVQDELVQPMDDLKSETNLETARSGWLDRIGDRLGVTRPLVESAPDQFFRFGETPFGQSPFYSTNPEDQDRRGVPDWWYRDILKARSLALRGNGSREDIIAAARVLFSQRIFWVAVAPDSSSRTFVAASFTGSLGVSNWPSNAPLVPSVTVPSEAVDVWVAASPDSSPHTFVAADFTPPRVATGSSGASITVPRVGTGNRFIAVAVPSDKAVVVSVGKSVAETDIDPSGFFTPTPFEPQSGELDIGSPPTTVHVWRSPVAVEIPSDGLPLTVRVRRDRHLAIAVPNTDTLDSVTAPGLVVLAGDEGKDLTLGDMEETGTVSLSGVTANVWVTKSDKAVGFFDGAEVTVETGPRITEGAGSFGITVTDSRVGLHSALANIYEDVLGFDAGVAHTMTVSGVESHHGS